MSIKYENEYISCTASINIVSSPIIVTKVNVTVNGYVKDPSKYKTLEILVPRKPDRNITINGSGLPFPNPKVAFDGGKTIVLTESHGVINNVEFSYPNSYYTDDATTKIPPSFFVILTPNDNSHPIYVRVELPDLLKLRTLTHRQGRTGPEFYNEKEYTLGIPTSAEQTMRMLSQQKVQYDIA